MTAAPSENGRHGGDTGGTPNAASSVASSVRPSRKACTVGLQNSVTATAHSTTVIPVSQRRLRRPSNNAATAKQTGSGTSHNAISGTTIPTGQAPPTAGVQTGHGKTVSSAADADNRASTSSDHRIAVTTRRLQGEGRMLISTVFRPPNDSSSATAATRRADCNRDPDSKSGFAAAHG